MWCVLGGEVLPEVSSTAAKAAEEAATGIWLREFESGARTKALAPGMSHGVFGAWAEQGEEISCL